MKAIATVNFKGGVGKTTITWLLAKYGTEYKNKRILVFDIDAQMSLTLAVQLQESGELDRSFAGWYNKHQNKSKTILNAIEAYENMNKGFFDFPIDSCFIYQLSDNLHFVPSIVDLYWLELDIFDKEKLKYFIRALLGKIEHSKFRYDYIFFDCPPNFTVLSYSVLSCSSLLLIPVNPDVFAARGVRLMIDGLRLRIQPWPNPKVAVFMNKAKLYSGNLTRETRNYWEETKNVCNSYKQEDIQVYALEPYIPDRVDIKRAIPKGKFPSDFRGYFENLWNSLEGVLT